jgi:hypothetical protein
LRVFALGQRLRHFADHVAITAGTANGQPVGQWFQDKNAGWYTVLGDPRMPVTGIFLDQPHHAIERKLFMFFQTQAMGIAHTRVCLYRLSS